MKERLRSKFQEVYGSAPTVVARAPGRLEFIGNHTDYNGGTVLGAALNLSVWVAIGPAKSGSMNFFSDLAPNIVRIETSSPTKRAGEDGWINYPLGVWTSMREFGLQQPQGFNFLAMADLPPGAGLSSSAAIELASALAYLALTGQSLELDRLVKWGRHAENNFVGVPCGILDQGVSGYGKRDNLVFIDCRGPRFEMVPLPENAHFWVFNTHSKHALIDSLYATRHGECMQVAKILGVDLLADVTLEILESKKALLTDVLYRRARHVLEEIERVSAVRAALQRGDLGTVGSALIASQKSSQTNFENSTPELDFITGALIGVPNVYGSRLTGGGFGGAVMALTSGEFSQLDTDKIAASYHAHYKRSLQVLHCMTGDGAELVD